MDSKGKFMFLRILTVDNVQEAYCNLLIESRRSDTDIYDVKRRKRAIPAGTGEYSIFSLKSTFWLFPPTLNHKSVVRVRGVSDHHYGEMKLPKYNHDQQPTIRLLAIFCMHVHSLPGLYINIDLYKHRQFHKITMITLAKE